MADTTIMAMAKEKKMSLEVIALSSAFRGLLGWFVCVFMAALEQTTRRLTTNENAETYLLFGAEKPSSFFAYQSAITVVVVRVARA
jgi:hypothetical protein